MLLLRVTSPHHCSTLMVSTDLSQHSVQSDRCWVDLTWEDSTVRFPVQMSEQRGSGLQMEMGLRAARKMTGGSQRGKF